MPDPCIDLTAAARSVQLFKINGFSATTETSGPIASRIWTVGGLDWRIEFHPTNRETSYSEPTLMFRVILISKATEVIASFGCRLVDPDSRRDPQPEIITTATFYQNKHRDVCLLNRRQMCFSGYLKDESFVVQCAITILLGEPKHAAAVAANAAPPRCAVPSSGFELQKHLGELLRTQKGADITFLVSGESVAAHRCVLAARSPVFMAELFGDMKEKGAQCVEITDMDAEVFKAMLQFIYTDRLPELEQEGEQATLMAQHLLNAADRYGLERLKGICVEKVFTSVTVDTVATTLALAEQHGCSNLKARCMEFILANLVAVAATEGYKHLEASCPSVLTELLKLMAVGRK